MGQSHSQVAWTPYSLFCAFLMLWTRAPSSWPLREREQEISRRELAYISHYLGPNIYIHGLKFSFSLTLISLNLQNTNRPPGQTKLIPTLTILWYT